jgi:hypothetical protein
MLPQKVKKGRKNCSILTPAGKFRHALIDDTKVGSASTQIKTRLRQKRTKLAAAPKGAATYYVLATAFAVASITASAIICL